MKLCDLLDAAGPAALQVHSLRDGGLATVTDVVILDDAIPLEPGQVVLAVGVAHGTQAARDLVRRADEAGAGAVVLRSPGPSPSPPDPYREARTSVLFTDPSIGWAQLLLLLRTLTSAVQDETQSGSPDGPVPSGMHGLADAIAVMVGGSVVLYDRAHRVIAYSVQGHEIDDVRRDAILGKRTPEQWIERFTVDRSAYQTYRNPDQVVRVDKYPTLKTRLRIAVHTGGEILGEISVAEGRTPLGREAEAALYRAASMAVPYMLRHRVAEDTERTARWQMLNGLLSADPGYHDHARRAGVDPDRGLTVVGFALIGEEHADRKANEVFAERLVHLLSLQMCAIDPAAGVVSGSGTYYAIVPTTSEAINEGLPNRLQPALAQLKRLELDACAAVSRRTTTLAELPAARSNVDDQLLVLRRRGARTAVGTARALWAEMVLLPAERAVDDADPTLREHLQRLVVHDRRNGTDFVTTLRVYLEAFGSTSLASERLVLHPNTLRHRISRLCEISGIDLDDPDQRLALALQLRADQHRAAGSAPTSRSWAAASGAAARRP
jgi:hypothetical protein